MARLNQVEMWMMNNPVRRAAQRFVELAAFDRMLRREGVDLRGARLLDAGCGSGYGTQLLARRYRPRRLVGVDLMPEQIERARRRVPGVELRVGDLLAIDEPDRSFDGVFVFGILHHIPAWRAVARELARVLDDGGVLLIEELHGDAVRLFDRWVRTSHPREAAFDWPTFRAGLQDAGFTIRAETPLAGAVAHSFLCRK